MRAIALVAGAVFRESIRDRVPYSMVIFAILLMAASFLISQMTAGQDLKIVKDLGLATIAIFGLLIAVFIGIGLVSKEVERKSIYGLLTKPVSRPQFVLGKFAGLVLTLVVNVSAMTLALYAVMFYLDWANPSLAKAALRPALDPRMLMAVLLILAELTLVTALALFFSTLSSPLLATLLTLGLWVAGHFNADLRNFENVIDSEAIAWLARGLYYTLPNLAPFDVKAEVVHGLPVGLRHVVLTLGYAAVYTSLLLVAAIAVFRRRDFK
jgi:ABC-type transport system involved in multi-copper enzyme maturation permease subunit